MGRREEMTDLKSLLRSIQSVPKPQDGGMTMEEVRSSLGIGRTKTLNLLKVGIAEGLVEVVPRKVKNILGIVKTTSVYKFKGKGGK